MLTTTLNRTCSQGLTRYEWIKLLKELGKTSLDDEPLPFPTIATVNGLDAALWCCRVEPQYHRTWRLFAVWCARQVQHLMTDPYSIAAIDAAERYANGNATEAKIQWAENWSDRIQVKPYGKSLRDMVISDCSDFSGKH